MSKFKLTATCAQGHTQTISYGPGFTKEMVQMQAGLFDGTSEWYVFPPQDDSALCQCGICGAKIKCQVTEEPDHDQ